MIEKYETQKNRTQSKEKTTPSVDVLPVSSTWLVRPLTPRVTHSVFVSLSHPFWAPIYAESCTLYVCAFIASVLSANLRDGRTSPAEEKPTERVSVFLSTVVLRCLFICIEQSCCFCRTVASYGGHKMTQR